MVLLLNAAIDEPQLTTKKAQQIDTSDYVCRNSGRYLRAFPHVSGATDAATARTLDLSNGSAGIFDPAQVPSAIGLDAPVEQAGGVSFRLVESGGAVEAERTFGGYTIPTRVRVDWCVGNCGSKPKASSSVRAVRTPYSDNRALHVSGGPRHNRESRNRDGPASARATCRRFW
jgi:hypothetical protein